MLTLSIIYISKNDVCLSPPRHYKSVPTAYESLRARQRRYYVLKKLQKCLEVQISITKIFSFKFMVILPESF